jgi:hypothetical protein
MTYVVELICLWHLLFHFGGKHRFKSFDLFHEKSLIDGVAADVFNWITTTAYRQLQSKLFSVFADSYFRQGSAYDEAISIIIVLYTVYHIMAKTAPIKCYPQG